MKNVHLLFLDHGISKSKTEKVISEKFNLLVFDFGKEFQNQLNEVDNQLTEELKSFISDGKIVPNYLLEKLLKNKISEVKNQDVLLHDFPRDMEHYYMLESILLELDMKIQTIWYIKQKNSEKYMEAFFKNPNEKVWLDKYGDEIIAKWVDEFEKKRKWVINIQNRTANQNWIVIEMDYEPKLNEDFIIKKINDYV